MRAMSRVFVSTLVLFIGYQCYAKRPLPADVRPLIYKGVMYTAPHWASENNSKRNGGYVLATEVETGNQMWRKRVYSTWYNPFLEEDVQDVFIVSIELAGEGDSLIITNEKGNEYRLKLKSLKVKKIKSGT
ncbi:hypothetical protein SAMN02745866_04339 [Alteromonadaceae bacterium Bs31]|nr:hypothetical protein SAMN02745866_04339 [Alteromonadaceae bacterium Bs31]